MVNPGARNLITDVPGLRVGHAEDRRLSTGVTVVLTDTPVHPIVDKDCSGSVPKLVGLGHCPPPQPHLRAGEIPVMKRPIARPDHLCGRD